MISFRAVRSFTQLTNLSESFYPEIYPAFNFLTKELISYPPHYGSLTKKHLQVHTPKKHMVYYTKLDEFLEKQKEEDKCHLAVPKEILFLGRSNVGKSSLLNTVFNKKIGNVSKTPGTTKNLIFHEIAGGKAFVVDAPGYGYADINAKLRMNWLKLLKTYLEKSSRISRVFLLLNMEHGVKRSDFEFIEFVNRYEHCIQVVLTKCDKLRMNDLMNKAEAIGHQLKHYKMVSPVVHVCSSKNKFGIDMLKNSVVSSFLDFHSKFDLEQLKYKLQLERLQAAQRGESNQQNLPPPEEMYRLLLKQGSKPSS